MNDNSELTVRADSDCLRQWTVVAAVLGGDRVGLLPAGVVVAQDLDMAAEQMCAQLSASEMQSGPCYLLATPAAIELDMPHGRLVTASRLTWVSRVHHEDGGWTPGEWVPSDGWLHRLDATRWPGG
ncbi:hypothetical protein AB0I30_27930 [Nocardia tengchongensis]